MIIDKFNLFSEVQEINATANSTNVIDLGASAPEIAAVVEKGNIEIFCQIDEAFNTLTSLIFKLETDDNSGFASASEVFSKTIVLADLTLDKNIILPAIPEGMEQYIRMVYTVVGVDPTLGKLTCGLVLDRQTNL